MKKLYRITIIICLLFLTNGALFAQELLWVGVPREQFNYVASSQRNTQWCWAASIQMVLNYYGVNISQEDVVQRSYGAQVNQPANEAVITANLNNWNVDKSGQQYVVQASLNWGAPTPLYLVNELANGHPVMIGLNNPGGGGHAVVITACGYVPTPNGPYIQSLVIRDPWPDETTIPTEGRKEYGPNQINSFVSRIRSHWYIRVN